MPNPGRARVRPSSTTALAATAAKTANTTLSQSLGSQSSFSSTYSFAALPPRYDVTLGHTREATAKKNADAHTAGAEDVSDAADRSWVDPLPLRRGLWSERERGKGCSTDMAETDSQAAQKGERKATGKRKRSGGDTERRTAVLLYPCCCTLPNWPRGKSPPDPPPTTADLSPLPSPPEPHQAPLIGDALLPWSTVEDGDIDPAMESLAEFQHEITPLWREIRLRFESGPLVPTQVDTLISEVQSLPHTQADIGKGRAIDKGKSNALELPLFPPMKFAPRHLVPRSSSPLLPPSSSPQGPSDARPPNPHLPSSFLVPSTPDPPSADPVATWHERRQWWGTEVESEGYHEFWAQLPRHSYPGLHISRTPAMRRAGKRSQDEFQLPRNLSDIEHPFHPAISFYLSHARTRVHWIIPVNGPVVVPGFRDPVAHTGTNPWASRAFFTPDKPALEETLSALGASIAESAAHPRPDPIHWTPAVLRSFVQNHFKTAWRDPTQALGVLHLACSGTKPALFEDEPPEPLTKHACLPPNTESPPPHRPEAGDHIRIYCEARRAMAVRLWLHWWTVEREVVEPFFGWKAGEGLGACNDQETTASGTLSAGRSSSAPAVKTEHKRPQPQPQPQDKVPKSQSKPLQPFKRARFALVGPRGEILVVA